MDHPIEASDDGKLHYRSLELLVEKASPEELRRLCLMLGQQALVVQPAAMRWLQREARRNLEEAWTGKTCWDTWLPGEDSQADGSLPVTAGDSLLD